LSSFADTGAKERSPNLGASLINTVVLRISQPKFGGPAAKHPVLAWWGVQTIRGGWELQLAAP